MKASPAAKKKVLFLPRWYPNRYDPMPGLFIRRHALSVAGIYDVAVLYIHPDTEMKGRPFEMVQSGEQGIYELSIYYQTSRSRMKWLASSINFYRFLLYHFLGFRRISKEFGKPDLLHVNVLTRLGFIALIYRIFNGKPYVITEHWTRYLPGMNNFRGVLRKRLTRMVVKHASAVMPVTLNLQKAMESHGLMNSNYRVIPNVVDTGFFVPSEVGQKDEKTRFIHVSCFDDNQKNISGILRVLKRLSLKRQDWICTLVGEGIHFRQLSELGEQLGLKDSFVTFAGLKESSELVTLMQQASFQFMFSRYENLPVVIPESFACGVPFISTRVGGIAEHIHPELGILVEPGDEAALQAAVEHMLDHRTDYDQKVIRQYALDHFSKEVIGKQIAGVYREILLKK